MFKFKGISSTDMQVIIEEEEHFIAKASKRYEVIEIEGRDGAIFNELGYSYVERPIYVQCLNIDKIDDILAWLDGEGELEYKGRKTTARFYSELEPQREGYIRIIDTTFIRDPFWIKANEEFVTVKESKVTETEESKSIYVEDASTIGQLEVLGNHEQETREGYNLLQNKLTDTTINGVTFKINEDKSVTVNGTATANIIANLITGEYNDNNATEPLIIPDNITNCRLSGCPSGGSISTYKLDIYNQKYALLATDWGEGTNVTIDSQEDKKIARVRIIIYSGATVNNLTFKPMLVAGTEEREYEQYGASPSPNYPSPVKCLGSNKNIFDGTNKNYYINQQVNSCGVAERDSGSIIDVKGKSNVTISSSIVQTRFRAGCVNSEVTDAYAHTIYNGVNKDNGTKMTINCEGYNYLVINATDLSKIKIEEGTEATSYSPYGQGSTEIKMKNADETQEKSYTLPIQQEMLSGDYFVKEADGWKEVHGWNKIESYNGESITTEYISTTGELTIGATIFYKTEQYKLPCTEEQIAVLEELNNLDLFEGVNNVITAEDIALLKLKYMKITDEKISNEGNVESRPIFRLEKTSTESVELTINNCRFKYNFNDEEYVEIDCEKKEVKYEGLNRNRQIEIGYEFPILNTGDNDIKMHSGDCVIKILRKDRWL